jgi:hypothetical protein
MAERAYHPSYGRKFNRILTWAKKQDLISNITRAKRTGGVVREGELLLKSTRP